MENSSHDIRNRSRDLCLTVGWINRSLQHGKPQPRAGVERGTCVSRWIGSDYYTEHFVVEATGKVYGLLEYIVSVSIHDLVQRI